MCKPACFWGCDTLNYIIKACVIMHNMIFVNEHGTNIEDLNDDESDENAQAKHHMYEQWGL
ncbi:hypothetical protein Ddye_008522 [Dipteronia dyeriana]|uniref:Uncharacterized protein n=1 Tax=Dipteronia dyeriana TaxID=168575 RepID=A0AAD9X9M5_9ROSI|nr:hypothetical protein Ddye_008522 [Dipteronia dyeriana]